MGRVRKKTDHNKPQSVMSADKANVDADSVLRLVVEGTISGTGTEFFRALVRNLCNALGTLAAWVTEYLPEERKLRAFAMWLGEDFVEHYEYSIDGTACEAVVLEQKLIHIPDRLIELFPNDPHLVPVGAASYLGMPLLDTDGSTMGHLGVLDNKPMQRDERTIALFEIFAARAAAELRRLRAEQEVEAREEQLSQLLESTMDAIVVLDQATKIMRINPAAERLFGCTAEDLLDEDIRDFLVEDSAAQVDAFTKEIRNRPAGKQQLWVPRDFVVRRWDHSVFPAEVTFSRFETRKGVYHTLILRNSDERLEAEREIERLRRETEYLREVAREAPGHGELLGRSDCMRAVFEAIRQVATTDSSVLITGETGTGKELVAQSIHRVSARAEKPLVFVNCAAIPANLIESEFFGYEKGAFTGAIQQREGRFSLADGGTIFLDEVGEIPLELQAKLLRVLQEGEFQPLGTSKTHKVDVRLIAATNRNLQKMVLEGKFREDLFFRLNVFPIAIPPLRERGRDVEQIASAFAERFARRMGKSIQALSGEQLKCLRSYDWPGNVRELQNVIERAVILTNGSKLALERAMLGVSAEASTDVSSRTTEPKRVLSAKELETFERENIIRALEACSWQVSGESGAARLIGIPPTTLSSRMKALKIRREKC